MTYKLALVTAVASLTFAGTALADDYETKDSARTQYDSQAAETRQLNLEALEMAQQENADLGSQRDGYDKSEDDSYGGTKDMDDSAMPNDDDDQDSVDDMDDDEDDMPTPDDAGK